MPVFWNRLLLLHGQINLNQGADGRSVRFTEPCSRFVSVSWQFFPYAHPGSRSHLHPWSPLLRKRFSTVSAVLEDHFHLPKALESASRLFPFFASRSTIEPSAGGDRTAAAIWSGEDIDIPFLVDHIVRNAAGDQKLSPREGPLLFPTRDWIAGDGPSP